MSLPNAKFLGFQPEGFWPTNQGVFLNRNSPILAWQAGTVTFSSAAVGAATITEQAVAVAGLTTNDLVMVMAQGAPTAGVGNLGTGRVSVNGTLQLRYVNPTAGGLTPPAATVYFFAALQIR